MPFERERNGLVNRENKKKRERERERENIERTFSSSFMLVG